MSHSIQTMQPSQVMAAYAAQTKPAAKNALSAPTAQTNKIGPAVILQLSNSAPLSNAMLGDGDGDGDGK